MTGVVETRPASTENVETRRALKAPFDLYRHGAVNGALAADGTFLVYREGDTVMAEHEAEVEGLTQEGGSDGLGDDG